MDTTFWINKKILITGHTGFKGTWLSFWLSQMEAQLKGISLRPLTEPNMYDAIIRNGDLETSYGDIRDLDFLKSEMQRFNPEIIIHFAAQSLVRESYKNPVKTLETNIIGTANVLEAARSIDNLKAILCITSDKCYKNNEWIWRYRENDEMGGKDPYSASKGAAELVISSYRHSFFNKDNFNQHGVAVASARAGNVIGGGDWAANRLVPDIMRSFNEGNPVIIRNPKAIRPWQHVLDVLRGYLMLIEKMFKNGSPFCGAWNFGPCAKNEKNVQYIVEHLTEEWGNGASWKLDTLENPHEATTLKLESSKARTNLGWEPLLSLNKSLEFAVDWYKQFYDDQERACEITAKQIKMFENECGTKEMINKSC